MKTMKEQIVEILRDQVSIRSTKSCAQIAEEIEQLFAKQNEPPAKLGDEEFLKQLDTLIEQSFVSAQFGDGWKAHADKNYSKEQLINIAWRQGRKAVMMQRFIESYKQYTQSRTTEDEPPAKHGHIEHKNVRYWFKYKLAHNGDLCLATKNPYKYCNGTYSYSDKDPGNGKAFVITGYESVNPAKPHNEPPTKLGAEDKKLIQSWINIIKDAEKEGYADLTIFDNQANIMLSALEQYAQYRTTEESKAVDEGWVSVEDIQTRVLDGINNGLRRWKFKDKIKDTDEQLELLFAIQEEVFKKAFPEPPKSNQ